MNIKKEQEEQIVNFGVFDYDSKKIASILGVDKKIIDNEFLEKDSRLNLLILKGKNISDYVIDLKLFDLAKTGDLKALDKLDERKKNRKF